MPDVQLAQVAQNRFSEQASHRGRQSTGKAKMDFLNVNGTELQRFGIKANNGRHDESVE